MSKHTPGPWCIGNFDWCIETEMDEAVAQVEVNELHNWKANARLIAAAPDLLAALKAITDKDG